MYCVKLTETCYSTCVALLVLTASSIVLICKSLLLMIKCNVMCVTYREQGLVRVDHELHHADDSGAVLHPRRALHAELLLWALLLVQQVRPEYGGQVQRRHLVTNHLQYDAGIINCIELSPPKPTVQRLLLCFQELLSWQMWSAWCLMEKSCTNNGHGRKKAFLFHFIQTY